MDKLSIFAGNSEVSGEVNIRTQENNTLDDVVENQKDILAQLEATHRGNEELLWGKDVPLDEDEAE